MYYYGSYSAKALRIHGKAYKALEEYEKARKDLSASQAIDYDGSTVEDMKFVTEKMKEIEAAKVKKKLEVSKIQNLTFNTFSKECFILPLSSHIIFD